VHLDVEPQHILQVLQVGLQRDERMHQEGAAQEQLTLQQVDSLKASESGCTVGRLAAHIPKVCRHRHHLRSG